MRDELAAMSQSTLREVTLLLIAPEKVPPIRATSDVDFREQQVMATLKPGGANTLVRSGEALGFLNRFNAQAPLLDELAGLFLEVIERPSRIGSLMNPYCAPNLVFEETLYAYEIVMLGASPAVMEQVLGHLVKGGWRQHAEKLADKLGRNLTRDEVLHLVRTYTSGASQSLEGDEAWPEFARKHLGEEGYRLACEWVKERNRRWANDLY